MSTSPTPEEREAADKVAKQREQEEQSALPYKWTQTIQDIDITISVPANIKGRDAEVKITRTSLKVGIKGQEPFIDVRLFYLFLDTSPLCPSVETTERSSGGEEKQREERLTRTKGRAPSRHNSRRKHMDPRIDLLEPKRPINPPRQSEQNAMVGPRSDNSPQDRHVQNHTREQ